MRLWGLGVATWSARQGPGARGRRSGEGRRHDAVGGPHLDRHGGRRGRVHRQPALRPGPGRRRPRRLARPRQGPRQGGHPDRQRGRRAHRRARHRRGGVRRRASSPSRPGDEDVHTAIERRVTELAGDVGRQAAHGTEPQRPGRHRPAPVVPPLARGRGRPRSWRCRTRWPSAPRGGRRLPAGLHPPAAGAARAAGPPPAGPRLGARPRRRPPPHHGRPAQRLAARRGRAGRLVAAARPRLRGRRARLPRPLRELARCGVRPRLRRRGALRPGPARRAPVAHGRGDRAVVDRGVRLLHARRRLRHRELDAARRRRTPTWPSWPAASRDASSATSPRCW